MNVHLIRWENIRQRVKDDQIMNKAFLSFYSKLKVVNWRKPEDVFKTFNHADIVKCVPLNRIVFNIGGIKFRMVAGFYFGRNYVDLYVKFVGTHSEYEKIDVCKVKMFKK